LAAFLKTQGVTLLPPQQYMDKFALTAKEVTPIANDGIKAALGFTKLPPTVSDTATEKIVGSRGDVLELQELRGGSRRGQLSQLRATLAHQVVADFGLPLAEVARQ